MEPSHRSLAGKTAFVTGATRGIGLAIAKRLAADGANVALLGKTVEPHPRLPGTLASAAAEVEAAGGRALPIACDIRFDDQVAAAVARTVATFGGIDVLVNNASAISLTGTLETPMKKFDLMFGVNVRGTFLCSQACLPHLLAASNPHVLVLAPPLNLDPKWFAGSLAYTMAKYGMSMCVLGLAEEFRGRVAANALWPATAIDTAAIAMLGGEAMRRRSRRPEIVADAAHWIVTRPARETTGRFFLDEEALAEAGVADLDRYAVEPGQEPFRDFFLD
jgi:citronellol/citronellal dehydrogenase